MWGAVSKIYLTPHKTHIGNDIKAELTHCGLHISGVAWWIKECYLHHAQRPVCKNCLRVFASKRGV